MELKAYSNTLFLFVLVVFFPPLVFAPWTTSKPPKKPENPNIEMTCPEWIEFSGFTLDNYDTNRSRTSYRDAMLDKDASWWAAIYAFRIGGVDKPAKLLPGEFCDSFGENMDYIQFNFSPLNEQYKTCHDWILLYGFSNDNHRFNVMYAENQKLEEMYGASIWAFSFYRFVNTHKYEFSTTPIDFCTEMGINNDEKDFINVNGPYLTCEAWIEKYDFNSYDFQMNHDKARYLQNLIEKDNNIPLEAHFIPRQYANFLLGRDVTENNWTPLKYCRTFISPNDSSTFSFLFRG